jgi:DNA-binding NarL/FixJ family response regulator
MSPIRVVLADDHALVLAGLRMLIERLEGVEVVAEVHDGFDAITAAARHRPNLVIMDISMKGLNGIDAAARIHEADPSVRVLILSSHTDAEFVRRALRAGAAGYLVKDSLAPELELAITAVMRGHLYVSPVVSKYLLGANDPNDDESALDQLSARQREVLQLIAEGMGTKEIASRLGISIKTVETHRAALMERLDIRDIPGLVIFAVRHGIIHLDRPGT